jgi:hypothetical protein
MSTLYAHLSVGLKIRFCPFTAGLLGGAWSQNQNNAYNQEINNYNKDTGDQNGGGGFFGGNLKLGLGGNIPKLKIELGVKGDAGGGSVDNGSVEKDEAEDERLEENKFGSKVAKAKPKKGLASELSPNP